MMDNNTSLRDHGSEECSATSSSRNILYHYHQTTPAYVIMALKPVQLHQVQEIFFTTIIKQHQLT